MADRTQAKAVRPLSVVTGASSGIGYQPAKLCARDGFDLVIAAHRTEIVEAAQALRVLGASVDELRVDLSTVDGVEALQNLIGDRPVDHRWPTPAMGYVAPFWIRTSPIGVTSSTPTTGTIYLVHKVTRRMVERGQGKVRFTGSIAPRPSSTASPGRCATS